MQTQNFTLPLISQGKHEVYGHGHLYVDDVKISRLYGEWAHLGDLTPGTCDPRYPKCK